MKGANAVTNAVGARDLADYAGSKLAKMTVPKEQRQDVSDTVSGKRALKSAGKLILSIASVTGLAGMARGAAAIAGKAALKASAKKMVKKAAKSGINDMAASTRMENLRKGMKSAQKTGDVMSGRSNLYKQLQAKKK